MKKNPLEWAVFAISLTLIALVIGVLAFAEATRGDAPPAFSITIGEIVETASGFAVQLQVRNTGDRTAEQVHLEVTLDGEKPTTAVLEYVPYHSSRRVWVTFTRDPRKAQLVTRILGFEES